MDATFERIARWLTERPWNRPGADRSWVLDAMWAALRFDAERARGTRPKPLARSEPRSRRSARFAFEAGGEAVVGVEDDAVLGRIDRELLRLFAARLRDEPRETASAAAW